MISVTQLGKKDTKLDWSEWDRKCKAILGRVIAPGEQMTRTQLQKMGFESAANALRHIPFINLWR